MSFDDRDERPVPNPGAVVELRRTGRHRKGRRSGQAVEPLLKTDEELLDLSNPEGELILPPTPEEFPYFGATIETTHPSVTPRRTSTASAGPGAPTPAPTPTPADEPTEMPEPRPGMVGSLRNWWREESLARAAEKRALATAEAILRAQAVQQATRPVDRVPDAPEQSQSVHAVLSLTEERFQSLGLRSDRLHDELTGISRTLSELRSLMTTGASPKQIAGATVDALGTLEARFDALLIALSEEFQRRSEETERRISEQLTVQQGELATMLEAAVERIRASIPEGFEDVKAAIPREIEQVRQAIPAELRTMLPPEFERLRVQQRDELDTIRTLSQKQIEALRAASREELGKIAASIPEGFAAIEASLPEELGRIR
ncbi:MAG TPA: hypothetical protein VEC09_09980, partial [Actinomycetota bacterium]|nr:hypothetical protein [Actinomycetota bacterium]